MFRKARSRGTTMTLLILLLSVIASVAAAPLQESSSNRLPVREREEASSVSPETKILPVEEETPAEQRSGKPMRSSAGRESKLSESLFQSMPGNGGSRSTEQQHSGAETKDKEEPVRRTRKHKAIFVNYPILPQLRLPNLPTYELDYGANDYDYGLEERTAGESKRYQESNIFYIRLPPTPYMFVPGLGYISQPPTYSTASLRPQLPSYSRPPRPKPSLAGNPFINLPIDFVSNGKPTSVYQWQKKPVKKPSDSPITNLDDLSASFVSNGKPTTIYQWQTNLKPAKLPELNDFVNNLDKGPYAFNGKPTSFFLLKPDGTATGHQSIRYPDYQEDNSYY